LKKNNLQKSSCFFMAKTEGVSTPKMKNTLICPTTVVLARNFKDLHNT